MKKLCLILPFLCSQVYALTDIEPKLANQMFNEKKAVIVDVREPNEVSQGSIKYSIKIPLSLMEHNRNEFEHLIERLPKDKEIYVYCRSGRRSKVVGEELEKRNLKVKNLGGYDKWKAAGLPTE